MLLPWSPIRLSFPALAVLSAAMAVAAADRVGADQPAAPGFVFEVKGGNFPVFLAGSVHFLPANSTVPLPNPIEAALARVDSVVFEILPGAGRSYEGMTGHEFATTPGPPVRWNLWAEVNPATRRNLTRYVGNWTDREYISRCTPWMAAIQLQQGYLEKHGYTPGGVESLVFLRAESKGLKASGLDTPDTPAHLLGSMSRTAQEEFLALMLGAIDQSGDEVKRMIQAWRDGDIQHIERATADLAIRQPEVYAKLLAGRNAKWRDSIRKLTTTGPPTLVLVGAMHLAGPEGLPVLLEQAGLEIQPLLADRIQPGQNPDAKILNTGGIHAESP